MNRDNQVYYFDIAEGRWRGEFSFRIERWREFLGAPISLIDRTLALILHANGLLPGTTRMEGEILGAPDEGDYGVARVEVSVTRFGFEIFRLSGHYALEKNGSGVDIAVLERYGPPGILPPRGPLRRDASIDNDGYRARYRIETLGATWEGVYDLTPERDRLDAEYRSGWGTIEERLDRAVRVVPHDPFARRRWERLLDIARRLESLNRSFDGEDDPRGSFAHVYSVITRNLAFGLDDSGFDDPDWVILLAEHFADCYFRAIEDWPRGTAPRAWTMVLDALSRHGFTTLEQFVLQMYVHIVHDSPRALAKAGLTTADGCSRFADHQRVDRLLSEAIDELQTRLGRRYNLAIRALDLAFLRHDELLASDRISGARERAWRDAERLLDPDQRYAVTAEIDERVRTVIAKAVGERISSRLLLRGLRAGIRALRLKPLHPPPAASLGAPEVRPRHNPTSAAVYALFTAISAKEKKADPIELARELLGDEVRRRLDRRSLALVAALGDLGWRDEIPRLLDRSPSDRYALAGLIGELLEGAELERALEMLRVSLREHGAIRGFQAAVSELLKGGVANDALAKAASALEALGIPTTSPLLAFRHLETAYDPKTKIFSTTVPAVFRVPFEEIQHVISPADWDESIRQVVDAHWVVPNEILYEEVNILHPWLSDHPLHLRSHLRIRETQAAELRKVEYRLEESLDGSLDVDQGFIMVESKGPNLSLVMIHKELRVKSNPLLFAMLRFTPDGLAALLSHWIHEASRRRMPSAA
jgi:hypothetical protein